jgi:putative Ca2+/H+ antiporter (TMEM165/GDT1 family)
MTMTIAADPGTALATYLKDAGPAFQAWIASTGISSTEVSATGRFWAVTLGSTVGMVVADAIAIGVGHLLGKKLPERLLRRISGAFFIVFGVFAIVSGVLAR